MCNKALREDPSSLVCVPAWFVTQRQIKVLHDDYDDDDGANDIIEWHDGYQKCRVQKAPIEKDKFPLLGIHQVGGIGALIKTSKKNWKIVKVTESCFKIYLIRNHHLGVNLDPRSAPRRLNKIIYLFKNVSLYIIREMCCKKILPGWCAFLLIPDRLKMQEMYDEVVARNPCMLRFIPALHRTHEMCEKAVEKIPQGLQDVLDCFKT